MSRSGQLHRISKDPACVYIMQIWYDGHYSIIVYYNGHDGTLVVVLIYYIKGGQTSIWYEFYFDRIYEIRTP